MQIQLWINEKKVNAEISADMLLIDFLREQGCYSVKRGCETSNCGLRTIFLDDKPILSCSLLAARADGHKVTTLEDFRRRPKDLALILRIRGRNSAASAIRDL